MLRHYHWIYHNNLRLYLILIRKKDLLQRTQCNTHHYISGYPALHDIYIFIGRLVYLKQELTLKILYLIIRIPFIILTTKLA